MATLVVGFCATAAHAALPTGYGPVGSFGQWGTGLGSLTQPTRLAVDDATGNILVADAGDGSVQVFANDGATSASAIEQFGSAELNAPYGIAIDQSNGAVYVSDSGTSTIVRYISDGAATPTYTVDPTFTSPALGSGPGDIGSFSAPLAVDPSNHDLIVGDSGNLRVSRYSPTGTFLSSFTGADTAGGPFTGIMDLAAGNGVVYVEDGLDPAFGGTVRVERFDGSGASTGSVAAPNALLALAVDGTQNRLVAGSSAFDRAPDLVTFAGVDQSTSAPFPAAYSGYAVPGVAIDNGASKRAYAITTNTFGSLVVEVLLPAPGVAIDPPSGATGTSFHLSGTVNPGGDATSAHFEYSSDGGATWRSTADQDVGGSASDQPIEADVTGLTPISPYTFRLVATHTATTASATSPTVSANTTTAPPGVKAGPTTDVTTSSAQLNGTINAFGLPSTYHFEYGTSTSYGQQAPASDAAAGSATTPRSTSRQITGLQPNTTYHFRLVATNSVGTAAAPDGTFTTDASAQPMRGYEQVSPIDKVGIGFSTDQGLGFWTRPDGDAVIYTTQTAPYAAADSLPKHPRFLAPRASGWAPRALDERLAQPGQFFYTMFYDTIATSRDLSRVLVMSDRSFDGQGVEGNYNLYVHDLGTNHYELVISTSDGDFLEDLTDYAVYKSARYLGGSDDLRTVAFSVVAPAVLTPDAAPGQDNIYVWQEGRGITAMPGGVVNVDLRDRRQVSADGARVYYPTTDLALRLWEGGTSRLVSRSLRSGDDPTAPVPGSFWKADSDGRFLLFTAPVPLTDDSPVGSDEYLYRYDATDASLQYLATGANTVLGGRPDIGEAFYYDDHDHMIKVARDGAVRDVAIASADPRFYAVSPNGRYLAFTTLDSPSGYDNAGTAECLAARQAPEFQDAGDACREAYVYDAVTRELTCVSCRPDGGPPTGDAQIGQSPNFGGARLADTILDDGTLYFDTTDPLVAADGNGKRDVYQYSNGRLQLISRGKAPVGATLMDVSPSGNDVFFATAERLVEQDGDELSDLYDARVGGGIASQHPVPAPAPCRGTDCDEPSSGPTIAPSSPSQTVEDVAVKTPKAASSKPHVALMSIKRVGNHLRLTVKGSVKGAVTVSGKGLTTTHRTMTSASTLPIAAPMTKTLRRQFSRHRTVRVSVRVSLTPAFGNPVLAKATRQVRK
ncbi:MAG TPA: hypothetical protein VI318_13865 [Baekduia sp.]